MGGDAGRDLIRFAAMLEAFERYLASSELYRKVTVDQTDGRHEIVTLSIGVMLDLADSLGRYFEGALATDPRSARDALTRFDALRAANHGAYREKLGRELRGNLDAWRWFVDDCRAGTAECVDDYPSEVRKRLRIHSLLAEGERRGLVVDDERRRAAALDDELRGVFAPDSHSYCGPRGEDDRYPEPRFWWLYGRPRLANDS